MQSLQYIVWSPSRLIANQIAITYSRENVIAATVDFFTKHGNVIDSIKQWPVKVRLSGESGVDEGGIRREWISSFGEALVVEKVFVPVGDSGALLMVNPKFGFHSGGRELFESIGKMVAIAIIENTYLGIHIPLGFFKLLRNEATEFSDLKSEDADIYRQLNREFDETVFSDVDFSVVHPGSRKDVYLRSPEAYKAIHRGEEAKQVLTPFPRLKAGNFVEYKRRLAYWKIIESQYYPLKWMVDGFYAIMPRLDDAKNFAGPLTRAIYMQKIFCGNLSLSRDGFLKMFVFNPPQDEKKIQAIWFIRYVRRRSSLEKWRMKFLSFSTGSPIVVPTQKITLSIGGVADIDQYQSCSGRKTKNDSQYFPVFHTCGFHVRIPRYKSYRDMSVKFDQALDTPKTFGII